MREGTARTSNRWGAQVSKTVDAGQGIDVAQFGDIKLLAPQELSLALYATATAPVAGLVVEWTLQIGNGSFVYTEKFTTAVLDETNAPALVLRRPAKTVLVSARIVNVAAAPHAVQVAVLVAPVAPTWLTDIACETALEAE